MNVWNKVFLGVIFVTAIVIVVLASVEFHIRNTGQKRIADLEKRIEDAVVSIDRIHTGADPLKLSVDKTLAGFSLEELRGVVRERYVERGRAWFGCRVVVAPQEEMIRTLPPALQQVVARVILTSPFLPVTPGVSPTVASPDTLRGVVYVFEEGAAEEGESPHAGTFLGRFTVEGTPVSRPFSDDDGNECSGWLVTLVSRDSLSTDEIDQIIAAVSPQSRWAVYLTPPIDRVAGIFSELTEEERQMIPEEFLDKFAPRPMPELTQEYVMELIERLELLLDNPQAALDAQEEIARWEEFLATWDQNRSGIELWQQYQQTFDDPESEFANDVAEMLDWLYLQRSNILRSIEEVQLSIASYEATYEKARAENDTLENADIPLEERRVEAMETQRAAVEASLKQYEDEVAKITLQIEKLQMLARFYVAKIAEAQFQAAEKIEEQIRNAAQTHEEVR